MKNKVMKALSTNTPYTTKGKKYKILGTRDGGRNLRFICDRGTEESIADWAEGDWYELVVLKNLVGGKLLCSSSEDSSQSIGGVS